jgi:hypothetical protein
VLAFYDLDKARPEFKEYCEKLIAEEGGVDENATFEFGNQCEMDDSAVIHPPCTIHQAIYRFIEG